MVSLTRGLWLRVTLAVVQEKARLARVLGMVPKVDTPARELVAREWQGSPIPATQHREIADSQIRDVLPRVLTGEVWDLTRALDAFLTALAHYSVAEGAAFELSDPDDAANPIRVGRVVGDELADRLSEALDLLDEMLATIAVSPRDMNTAGIVYRATVPSETLSAWAERKGRIVKDIRFDLRLDAEAANAAGGR